MFLYGKMDHEFSRGAGMSKALPADETLIGTAGDDYLQGGAGDDLLIGGAGGDILLGGAGSDTVSYDGAGQGMIVDLTQGLAFTASVRGAPPAEMDFLSRIENVQGGAFADDIYGDAGDNHLAGGAGADWLDGGEGGRDTLDGGAGADGFHQNLDAAFTLVLGGEGNDLLVADDRGAVDMVFDLRTGEVSAGGVVTMELHSVEYIHGAGGNDVFFAAEGRSIFHGGDGADLFVFAPGTAAASSDPMQIDAIFQFGGFAGEDGDMIFLGVAGGYTELAADAYAEAYSVAHGLLTSGARDIVAVQVEGDVFVFADVLGDNTLNTAIKLEAADLSRIGEGDFI